MRRSGAVGISGCCGLHLVTVAQHRVSAPSRLRNRRVRHRRLRRQRGAHRPL